MNRKLDQLEDLAKHRLKILIDGLVDYHSWHVWKNYELLNRRRQVRQREIQREIQYELLQRHPKVEVQQEHNFTSYYGETGVFTC